MPKLILLFLGLASINDTNCFLTNHPRSTDRNRILRRLQGLNEHANVEIEVSKAEEIVSAEFEDVDAVTALAGNIVQCLFKSDLKRKGGGDGGGSTGWTSWVDDASAFSLRCCIDALAITKPVNPSDIGSLTKELLMERDLTQSWLRWMKGSPSPMIVDMSQEIRDVAKTLIYEKDLETIQTTEEEFLSR